MKHSITFLLSPLLGLALACGGGAGDTGQTEDDSSSALPVLELADISFGLDGDRLLSSLSDAEIGDACRAMTAVLEEADAGVACQIVGAAEAASEDECLQEVETCLHDPSMALSQTELRSAPAPIDCSDFDAALTATCDHKVSLLQDCANALAASVVPSAAAVACAKAEEIDDIGAANSLATVEKDVGYLAICAPLLECDELVSTLLGGGS